MNDYRRLLKAYMLVIYKLTGDCGIYNFRDLNRFDVETEKLVEIEREILAELKDIGLAENIHKNTIHVSL